MSVGACGGQKGCDPLEPESQSCELLHMAAGSQTGPLLGQQVLLAAEHL